jgi:penicillin-binding protein 2
LLYLQVIEGKELRRLSEINSIRIQDVDAPRGLILDRYGKTLVENRPAFNLYVIPKDAKPLEATLEKLERLLDEPAAELARRISSKKRGDYTPVLIQEDITRDTLAALEVHRYTLPGVVVRVSPRRHYLSGPLAAHVLGYMGEISAEELQSPAFKDSKGGDYIGKFGIEKALEKQLRGKRGGRQVEVNAVGQVERILSSVAAQPGYNVHLTIDAALQTQAEDLLKGLAGALVAVDATNGDILAMASSPSFDPNGFVTGMSRDTWSALVENPFRPLENKAIQAEYPPASTYKIVTAVAGLEEGAIDEFTIFTCPGFYRYGNRVYRCWQRGGHGPVNVVEALEQSCDVFFYQVGEAVGVDRLAHYAQVLGLGAATDLKLDREAKGLVPTAEWKRQRLGVPWQGGETLSIAIGQGFNLATPLQMALMTAAVGNGGIRYHPNLIQYIEAEDDQAPEYRQPRIVHRLTISPTTMALVHKGLWGVVNGDHGTARASKFQSVAFSGKTGTAQVVARPKDQESGEGKVQILPKDHAWFVAYAPSVDPKIAVAVIIEHGEHGSWAAPLAREIIRSFLNIPEDDHITQGIQKRIQQMKQDLQSAGQDQAGIEE